MRGGDHIYGSQQRRVTPAGAIAMTGGAAKLTGTWRKITTSACATKYPETIRFDVSTYLGARGKDQGVVWWDAGIYRLEDEGTLVLSTASDELVTYRVKLIGDNLDVVAPDGCAFSYRREASGGSSP
jgi:hypothetical protein